MTIKLQHRNHQSTRFPGGERHVRLLQKALLGTPTIIAHIQSSDDVMELLMVTDALRRETPGVNIRLRMPYIPYARQDRVCNPGEALSIKVFADLINSQNYSTVEVWDPHSDVSVALLDRCEVVPQDLLLEKFIPLTGRKKIAEAEKWSLVSPDAGALKKIHASAKRLKMPIVEAGKSRDTMTGEITGTAIHSPHSHIDGRNMLIVDDICDGGRTFIELAKELRARGATSVWLYVTHGIFSKKLEALKPMIDGVLCPNPWPGHEKHNLLQERLP